MLRDLTVNLRDLQRECKEYFLKTDMDLTTISMGAAAFVVPPLSYLDYTYYGFSGEFFLAVTLEGLFVLVSIFLIIYFRYNSQLIAYETLVFAWSMVLAVAALFADFLQPNRITENVLISDLLIIALYMVIANRFIYRIIPITTITMSCMTALFITDNSASWQEKYLFIITLILLNAVGIVVLSRNNRFKRTEYELLILEQESRRKFEEMATSDPLTGILNRRSFIEHTRLAIYRFVRYQTVFSLVILDLDHLKRINDTYGHLAGDQAIKQITSLVESNKRLTDVFGRLGGDEFGFILPGSTQSDGLKVIARLQETLRGQEVKSANGHFHISFSAGITEVLAEDKSADDLMLRADKALYLSKSRGGDQAEQA
jgi:diguanylate cyclase (GGDEF)-like protein